MVGIVFNERVYICFFFFIDSVKNNFVYFLGMSVS